MGGVRPAVQPMGIKRTYIQYIETLAQLYVEEYVDIDIDFSGPPPHKMFLNINTPIMLLQRNIDIQGSDCNGTRYNLIFISITFWKPGCLVERNLDQRFSSLRFLSSSLTSICLSGCSVSSSQ